METRTMRTHKALIVGLSIWPAGSSVAGSGRLTPRARQVLSGLA